MFSMQCNNAGEPFLKVLLFCLLLKDISALLKILDRISVTISMNIMIPILFLVSHLVQTFGTALIKMVRRESFLKLLLN